MNESDLKHAWPAPAKLNLFLHITARRADGYHLLQTVFQLLDYGDELEFTLTPDDSRIVLVDAPVSIDDQDNLCVKAAEVLRERNDDLPGVRIRLHKRIPIGAGLGGGSSDAATCLVALNQLWGLKFDAAELARMSLRLGADVPVFVHGESAWAEGVGERLLPLELPASWYLVVYPGVHVSTAEIFSDEQLTRDQRPITIADFRAGTANNVMTSVVCAHYPEVERAIDWLSAYGRVSMSGSGSSLFLRFDSHEKAQQTLAIIQSHVPNDWTVFVAQARNRSGLQDRLEQWFETGQ